MAQNYNNIQALYDAVWQHKITNNKNKKPTFVSMLPI